MLTYLNIAQMEIINIDNKPVPCVLSSTWDPDFTGRVKNETHCPRDRFSYVRALRVRCVSFTFEQTNERVSVERISSFQNDVTLSFPASIDFV